MKALSIKQPFASLLVAGVKHYETRSWAAPLALIGQRVAICSSLRNETAIFLRFSPLMAAAFEASPLDFATLPYGKVLGIMTLEASVPMTPEFISTLTDDERAMGDFTVGRHAWRFVNPEPLAILAPVRGRLGFFEWNMDT